MHSKPSPNIIVFMTDEQPVFMTGCYGDTIAQTPTMNQLAATGAVFDSAYCASPICCPCRAAMMTSRPVHDIEVWDNASPLRSDWPTFAHTFRAAGYRTVLCGKMHFVGPDQHHGFEERWVPDIYPANFEWSRSNRAGAAINDGAQSVHSVLAAGVGETEDMAYDELVVRTAETRLPELQADTRPFLLVVSITGPHYPFKAPQRYWDMFDGVDIPLPQLPEDFPHGEHPAIKSVRLSGQFDQPVSDEICRAARRAIYGRMALADDLLARVHRLAQTDADGTAPYFVFLSDHGDMMGEHGLWYKNCAFEASARVPFIVNGPDITPRRIAETISLLDLGPTLTGLANIDPLPVPSAGRNLAPLLRRDREETVGEALIENYGEGLHRGVRTVVAGPFKLSLTIDTPPLLFDLRNDPDEWRNVAPDPAYADVLARLSARLDELAPEPETYDEARWASEERRLAIRHSIPAPQQPAWQSDWHDLLRPPA